MTIQSLSRFFAAALVVLPLPARAQTAAPQPAVCALKLLSSLDMSTDPDGRVTVPASVNDRPVRLLVDTGDIYAALASPIADELKLRPKFAPPMVLAGNIPITTQVDVDKFLLGRLHTADFSFMEMPSQTMEANDDGLFGGSILNNYDAEFDFAHAKFNLFAQDHCPGQVVYWTKSAYAAIPMSIDGSWHISVPVMLNGKALTAVIDTGAAHSVMPVEVAKEIFGIDTTNPVMKSLGRAFMNGNAVSQIYRYPFSTLTFQDVTVNNPEIDLVPQAEFFRRGGPQLVIGIGVLRQLHIYVGYGEKVLYVTPAEAW